MALNTMRQLGQFNPQGLTNVMWAFATLDYHPGKEMLDRWIGTRPKTPNLELCNTKP